MSAAPPDLYHTAFDAAAYLRTYYTAQVYDDDRAIFAAARTLTGGGETFERCLEVGCGPTVHHAVPFVPYVEELHLADYLPANLAEVRRWLDRDPAAHDWSMHVREVLRAEGRDAGPDAVAGRMDELRRKVTALAECDLRRSNPLGDGMVYDLVTSFYTAECAATTVPEWRAVMGNLLGLVRPGGCVFLASVLDCERYDVRGRWFETARVSVPEVAAVLAENGFPAAGVRVETVRTADMAEHGFAGVYVATGTKEGV